MFFSVADFLRMVYDGVKRGNSPHKLTIVAPRNEHGGIYFEIIQQFYVIQQIFSMLLLTTNLKPFHVFFYALPNNEVPEPVVRGGVCYYNFEDIHFQLDLEQIYKGHLRCLLYQGFMNDRKSDSWTLLFAPEGLFEKFLSTFQVCVTQTVYFRDAIEGDKYALTALGKQFQDVTIIPHERPYRKAAGFFTMLGAISPAYAELTYSAFEENNSTDMETTYSTYLNWVTQYTYKLGLKKAQFLEVLDTWTMADGYVVIKTDVLVNKTVCVRHYNVGAYLKSYVLPIQVDYHFPATLHSRTIWTDPRVNDANCVTVVTKLYPYLINSYFNMVGRVLYDRTNWLVWANELMLPKVRNGMGAMRKVALASDALFFAGQRKLNYSIALRYLFAMQTEETEEAWRNFDRTLEFLDAKIRYTPVYTLFKKTIGEVSERYFNASAGRASETAHKWSCMMGNLRCLEETEIAVEATLSDHRFRHLPEVLCAGMRRLRLGKFHQLVGTMGRPDWREPKFYVQMMLCAENRMVLRELMHHMFFMNSWRFKRTRLRDMVMKMIRRSKEGSTAVFNYLNHDPWRMVDVLGLDNVLDVVETLAEYQKENHWLMRFVGRLRLKHVVGQELFERIPRIMEQLKENKRWYNSQYEEIREFFMRGYGRYWKRFQALQQEYENDPNFIKKF